jgi:rubrerythrin
MPLKTYDDYREALKLAIKREEDAFRFYQGMADKVHQPDPKALLKRLAIEEKEHKKILAEFASEVKNQPEGAFTPPEYSFDQIEDKNLTIDNIFKMAIQLEEESLNFYSRFLVYFFKTGHEEIFRNIFEVELRHKEELERNFQNFTKK